MKKKKWIWTTGSILLVFLLFSLGFRYLAPSFSAQALTEEEANNAALDKYPGDIVQTTKTQDGYQIEMQLETGVYFIQIDAKSGDIISLKQAKKSEPKTEQQLTQQQIEQQIAPQGELQSIEWIQEKDSSYYRATVRKDNEVIMLKIDPFTAEIIESNKEFVPSTTENKIITEQEAISIAANHLKGKADDDAEFHRPKGQNPYYLVEVELKNGDNDREAIVQVDAYTGSVKSVNWED